MALRVINHYPAINAIDIPRNIYVKIEFNSGIIPGSLDYTHISVNDAANFTTVPGDLGLEYTPSGISSIIRFQPLLNMTANAKYRVYVFGSPNSVISTGNEQLTSTYSWEFTTGTGLLQGQMPTGIPSGALPTGIPSGALPTGGHESGVYTEATISGELLLSSVYPLNMEPNVDTDIPYIKIKFDKNIASSASELSGLISVQVVDVLY